MAIFIPLIQTIATSYPPISQEKSQEQLGEDSQSELWAEVTEAYYGILEWESREFDEFLDVDPPHGQVRGRFNDPK